MARYWYEKYETIWKPENYELPATLTTPHLPRNTEVFVLGKNRTLTSTIARDVSIGDFFVLSGDWIATGAAEAVQKKHGNYATTIGRYAGQPITAEDFYALTLERGAFVGDIVAEDGTYPTDGIHTDGYWYVRGKKAVAEVYSVEGSQYVKREVYYVENGAYVPIAEIWTVENGQYVKRS